MKRPHFVKDRLLAEMSEINMSNYMHEQSVKLSNPNYYITIDEIEKCEDVFSLNLSVYIRNASTHSNRYNINIIGEDTFHASMSWTVAKLMRIINFKINKIAPDYGNVKSEKELVR